MVTRMRSERTAERGSVWTHTTSLPDYSPLSHDVRADVCVVGAGISGLSAAYQLVEAGRTVVVLEDGPLASGATADTTAHLSSAIDDGFLRIAHLHGQEGARLAAESHSAAIAEIERIVRQESIDCDFERVDGYLFASPDDDPNHLRHEMEAARGAGIAGVELANAAPLPFLEGISCLRFPNQAQFHPLKYLTGLAAAISARGGRIFTGTHADRIEGGSPALIKAGAHLVAADAVVVATNTPVNDMFAIHTKQSPYMTYAIGLRVPRGSVRRALYWDTAHPYHYVRVHPMNDGTGSDLLIVGGEDHKTGQADDAEARYERLAVWARHRFGPTGPIDFRWAGQVMETIDGLAFIGHNPLDLKNVFVATGDSGMGMTHGTIAGLLLRDLILGRENRWETLYEPSRKTLRAAGTFVRENANVAAQYAHWLQDGDVSSTTKIPPGQGAVVRHGLRKVATYRDGDGRLHERSAVCPHLGCPVQWNPAARTWDCPCHGSRFDPLGRVMNGPANRDLGPAHLSR